MNFNFLYNIQLPYQLLRYFKSIHEFQIIEARQTIGEDLLETIQTKYKAILYLSFYFMFISGRVIKNSPLSNPLKSNLFYEYLHGSQLLVAAPSYNVAKNYLNFTRYS